jgi:hypothetical protein
LLFEVKLVKLYGTLPPFDLVAVVHTVACTVQGYLT